MESDSNNIKNLFEIIPLLETPDEAERFLADLCTPQEIKILQERWKVCQLLDSGELSYREIREITGASTTTITRVARFLNDEPYMGYKILLRKIKKGDKNA
ncbi:MAG: trp operon repressor [Holosporales bacterium]|jgi:TrpR-related protein YerC/YecD|nr:trp operon repressor [Holosporales bacterium]